MLCGLSVSVVWNILSRSLFSFQRRRAQIGWRQTTGGLSHLQYSLSLIRGSFEKDGFCTSILFTQVVKWTNVHHMGFFKKIILRENMRKEYIRSALKTLHGIEWPFQNKSESLLWGEQWIKIDWRGHCYLLP